MNVAERYSRAAHSSDLRVKVEPGDVDVLIAAGLVRESLATRLIRVRAEFDRLSGSSQGRMPLRFIKGHELLQAHLVAFAVQEQPIKAPRLDTISAAEVATKLLGLLIDPNCQPCDGRGFVGGYGTPTIRCTNCRESGKRQPWWPTDEQEAFAKWLQHWLESKTDAAMTQMRRLLRERA